LNSASVDPDYFNGIVAIEGLLQLLHSPVNGTPTRAQVDIKPGSYPNPINPRSNGVMPVAILGSSSFDVTTVNIQTVKFGPGQTAPANGTGVQDINGDGIPDLVLHFDTRASQITCTDTAAFLNGQTTSGQPIVGSDSIMTVGCK
jgi:hypothetical protein